MSFLGRPGMILLVALFFGAAGGCSSSDQGQADEEKEPHFVLGNSRFNAMDYPGAIEAFEESLEVNPHSAQAHYRLAQLFDTKESDPAAAIYHYNEFIRLNPKADNLQIIQQRIGTCKQQLAGDVLSLPSAPQTMKQIDQLAEKNHQLQQQVDDLTEKLKQWNAYYNNQQAAKSNPPVVHEATVTSQAPDDSTAPTTSTATTATPVRPQPPKARTHIVAAGETLAAIARKHNVSLTALQAANPGVTPKKLHVGQPLNLPPS